MARAFLYRLEIAQPNEPPVHTDLYTDRQEAHRFRDAWNAMHRAVSPLAATVMPILAELEDLTDLLL